MLELNEVAVSELIRPEIEGVVRLVIPDGYVRIALDTGHFLGGPERPVIRETKITGIRWTEIQN